MSAKNELVQTIQTYVRNLGDVETAGHAVALACATYVAASGDVEGTFDELFTGLGVRRIAGKAIASWLKRHTDGKFYYSVSNGAWKLVKLKGWQVALQGALEHMEKDSPFDTPEKDGVKEPPEANKVMQRVVDKLRGEKYGLEDAEIRKLFEAAMAAS